MTNTDRALAAFPDPIVLDELRVQVIREAGHAASEPGITDALVRATGEMARRLLDLPPEEA